MEPSSRQGRSPISLLGSTMFYVVLQFSNRKRTSPPTCGGRYRCRSIGTRWLCVGDGTAFLRFICGTFCFFFFILTRVQAIGTAPPGVHVGAPGLNGWCNLHSVSQDHLCVSSQLGISIIPPDRMHESKQLSPEEQQQQERPSMFKAYQGFNIKSIEAAKG